MTNTISNSSASLHLTQGRRPLAEQPTQLTPPTGEQVKQAKELRDAFGQMVGFTVFGQMLKSMRSTVGEPAYFHGGRAEEVFQQQLDQTLVDEITQRGESPFAKAMFEHQFPKHADVLNRAEEAGESLDQLSTLRRW